jgi:hypothetical protein
MNQVFGSSIRETQPIRVRNKEIRMYIKTKDFFNIY